MRAPRRTKVWLSENAGLILPVGAGELLELDEDGPWLDDNLVNDIAAALMSLFDGADRPVSRPGRYPHARQTRFADLNIPGCRHPMSARMATARHNGDQ